MGKLLFVPVSLVSGLIAGLVSKKVFSRTWGLVDTERAPSPKHRKTSWPKLVSALLLEGAIFRATRGVVDHAARVAYARVTGKWPGEERPKQTV